MHPLLSSDIVVGKGGVEKGGGSYTSVIFLYLNLVFPREWMGAYNLIEYCILSTFPLLFNLTYWKEAKHDIYLS